MAPTRLGARVFISSTSGDLDRYRKAAVEVCLRAGLTPVYMEEFAPERRAPLDVCRSKVDESDVFVLLLGERYGSLVPNMAKSFTEVEYDRALERSDMEILGYIVEPSESRPADRSQIQSPAEREAQERLIAKVRTRHVVGTVREVPDFRVELVVALSQYSQGLARSVRSAPSAPSAPSARIGVSAPVLSAFPPYAGGGTPFTGRLKHLDEINEWARSKESVMVVEAIGGTGKSALTWEWVKNRAAESDWAGRFWWSFYDGSSSIVGFLRELLVYATGRPFDEVAELNRSDLSFEVLSALRRDRFLVVLDGFERVLNAFHRFDRATIHDEEVQANRRAMTEPNADDFIKRLVTTDRSKILISTRLVPQALEGRARRTLTGVQLMRLPGLSDEETRTLLSRLDVHGAPDRFVDFFQPLDNHPLLIEIVAGLVRGYRPGPGDFDLWRADPSAGAALDIGGLDLVQRRNHILSAALDGLAEDSRELLGSLSVLDGTILWESIQAVYDEDRRATGTPGRGNSAGQVDPRLDAALADLEDRGLLWWDRSENSYDMHPIVRASCAQSARPRRPSRGERSGLRLLRRRFLRKTPKRLAASTTCGRRSRRIGRSSAASSPDRGGDPVATPAAPVRSWSSWAPAPSRSSSCRRSPSRAISRFAAIWPPRTATSGSTRKRSTRKCSASDLRSNLDDAQLTALGLSRLSSLYGMSGAGILASRCLELCRLLRNAANGRPDANLSFKLGVRAAVRGATDEALGHFPSRRLRQVDRREPLAGPRNFLDGALIWPQGLVARSTSRLSTGYGAAQELWGNRTTLTRLQCDLTMRRNDFAAALELAVECERLEYAAGIEAVPATAAVALAKLGRRIEAFAAVEDSIDRMAKFDVSARPHSPDRAGSSRSWAGGASRSSMHERISAGLAGRPAELQLLGSGGRAVPAGRARRRRAASCRASPRTGRGAARRSIRRMVQRSSTAERSSSIPPTWSLSCWAVSTAAPSRCPWSRPKLLTSRIRAQVRRLARS